MLGLIGGQANAAALLHLQLMDGRSAQLIEGVQNGNLNQEEFIALQMMVNRQAGENGEAVPIQDGAPLHPLELMTRDQATGMELHQDALEAQAEFDRLYQEYTHGDYHPATYAENGIESRQVGQLDNVYEGLSDGSIGADEGRIVLSSQRTASFHEGRGSNELAHQTMNQADHQLHTASTGDLRPSRPL